MTRRTSFHDQASHAAAQAAQAVPADASFTFQLEPFFHPYVGTLIQRLNQTSVAGMLDPVFLSQCRATITDYSLTPGETQLTAPTTAIDVGTGPYANYNWELLYHLPVLVAVHLSNNQRFAEAQSWFHLVFDPTATETLPTASILTPPTPSCWRSFVFTGTTAPPPNIETLLTWLSTPDSELTAAQIQAKTALVTGYDAILADPFEPHVVARTRHSAYQWYVVMKYLDNLIAWGDSLFLQDTVETINEATLCYVLAANLLGPRPGVLPQLGAIAPRSYRTLKQAGMDRLGNALVELEAQFPLDLLPAPGASSTTASDLTGPLFGIGRSLYFCIPQNTTLTAYWDTVADRLFKIRNSENIQGTPQTLPLFDPPLNPGLLVQAAAAGIDIGSIVSGQNQPIGPVRAPLLIQKALEIAAEVRALGGALLAAYEKHDAEQLALLRQSHELQLQQLVQNVRFLQWQHARQQTTGLLATRASAVERYSYYLRLIGLAPDPGTVPASFALDRRELTEATFPDAYAALVQAYSQPVALQAYPALQLAQAASPANQSGASGTGALYLNQNEDAELNTHLPSARDTRVAAGVVNTVAAGLMPIPSLEAHLAFWGMGVHSKITAGDVLSSAVHLAGEVLQIEAAYQTDQAGIAARTAGYKRRTDEWLLQANLAAHELMQIGQQLLASLLEEQVAYHDYTTLQAQVQQAQDVQAFLKQKYTNVAFYSWMQSEIAGLYYQYYRLACDTARKAEQTMKQELMRPELDAVDFIQYNYWNTGYQGLLSGEALYLDIKRMELAYHDSNKRELEMTRHVSLRQLDPASLVQLRTTGTCTVTIPEWLFDRDCPGHYMRRIKSVALSLPSVVGPYTSLNCTLSLQSSQLRVSPELSGGTYRRLTGTDDPRFVDYYASTDLIVTSTGTADAGMFETNLRDDRFLPFEGAGAISTWTLTLPAQLPAFDYLTIADAIISLRYTARSAGGPLAAACAKEMLAAAASPSGDPQYILFNLRYDFPTEWAAFVAGTAAFTAALPTSAFPYAAQTVPSLTVLGGMIYAEVAGKLASTSIDPSAITGTLGQFGAATATLTLAPDGQVLNRAAPQQQVFLVLQYYLGAAT